MRIRLLSPGAWPYVRRVVSEGWLGIPISRPTARHDSRRSRRCLSIARYSASQSNSSSPATVHPQLSGDGLDGRAGPGWPFGRAVLVAAPADGERRALEALDGRVQLDDGAEGDDGPDLVDEERVDRIQLGQYAGVQVAHRVLLGRVAG